MAVPVGPVAPSSAVPCRSSWCIASRRSRRGSCGSRWPCAARRKQAATQDRTAGRKCVAALFHAGETDVSDPRLPAVMENGEGRLLHLLRFRTGPGKTGARDRYGHALTGWEAGSRHRSRHYAATAGSTWRRRRPRSWASGRPQGAGWTLRVHRLRWFRDRHPVTRGGGSRRPGWRPTPGACRCGRAPSRRPQCSTGWRARARRCPAGDWSRGLERGQQAQGFGVDAVLHFPDEIARAQSAAFIDAAATRRPRRATGALRVS